MVLLDLITPRVDARVSREIERSIEEREGSFQIGFGLLELGFTKVGFCTLVEQDVELVLAIFRV